MKLELSNKEFQSIILQLMYNNLFHLTAVLNILYSLLFAVELRNGIIKQPNTYL